MLFVLDVDYSSCINLILDPVHSTASCGLKLKQPPNSRILLDTFGSILNFVFQKFSGTWVNISILVIFQVVPVHFFSFSTCLVGSLSTSVPLDSIQYKKNIKEPKKHHVNIKFRVL